MAANMFSDVVYPSTWRAESVAWARTYKGGMTQAEVDAIETRLVEFRRKRDSYVAPPTKPCQWIEIDWSPRAHAA